VDNRRLRSANVTDTPLPEPDSEVLYNLVGGSTARVLYGWLYRRRDNPPTMAEVRLFMTDALGEPQEHIDRRLRELRRHFKIPAVPRPGGAPRYELQGWAEHGAPDDGHISARLRAQVLAPQRCFQCGRTPRDDGVKLVVDHKIPRAWGGPTSLENLQPLCVECNHGKRDYLATHDQDVDRIRTAMAYAEPQKRIGELLKAFGGQEVRSDLIGIVASAQEYQEDWQRRLRDLRFLGWDYKVRKTGQEGARIWSYYRLTQHAPWPDNIREALKAEEARRRSAKVTRPTDR
jgi:hypothetical protein